MIVFPCPDCAKELKVKTELAGKKGKCPHCKTSVTVPNATGDGQKTLVGARKTDDAKTLAPAKKPALGDAKTLAPPAKPSNSKLAAKPKMDAETLLPGGPGKSARKNGDTIAPDGADLADSTAELTEFLEPAQGPDELGRLGKYRIVKILGAGGMGVVYQAEDTVLKRSAALKALLPGMNSSKSARDRFLREAQSSAALQHDNVVTVYEVNEANNVPFLAMQLLQGEALDARLTREATLPLDETLRIGRETAEGLAAAHDRGMIHRDIKPANLFLEAPKGRVKILDFGLARPTGESKMTQLGAVVGTPGYLSPEQANGKPVDARGDLFSLGCVLYRLTTGELPFKGEDMLSLLTSLATTEPAPPSTTNIEVPPALSDLIMRLLAKDPARRPASAHEVSEALGAIAGGTAPEPIPMMAVVEDDVIEDLVALPAESFIEGSRRPTMRKEEAATTARPAPRRDRDDDFDDRDRPPRDEDGFPMWIVWTASGVALFLVVLGLSLYFALRKTDDTSNVATADEPKPKKDQNPRDGNPRDGNPRDGNPRDGNPRDGNPRDGNPRDPNIPVDPPKTDKAIKAFRTTPVRSDANHWLAFSPDNKHFVSAPPNQNRIYFWDIDKPDPEYAIEDLALGTNVTQAPRYSSDGKKVILGLVNTAVVLDVDEKRPVIVASLPVQILPKPGIGQPGVIADRLVGVGFDEKDAPLAVFSGRVNGTNQQALGLFDVDKKIQRGNGRWFPQESLAPNPSAAMPAPAIPTVDGQGVIVVTKQGTRIWEFDEKGWSSTKAFNYIEREPKCYALSPDGKIFLTSHHKNVVRVWNAKTGDAMNSHTFGTGEFDYLGFTADSKLGICAGHNGVFNVFDLESGEIKIKLTGPHFMTAGVLSPDMKHAIGSSWGGGGTLLWYQIPPKP